MRRKISIFILLLCLGASAVAQQRVSLTAGAEVVSSYIWRGTYNAGASFQPSIKAQIGGFAIGAWGSTDFIGEQKKEVDLSASYTIKGATLSLTDYWWDGEGAFNYFGYRRGATSHRWEATIAYQLPVEKFPLIISWSTIFAGGDYEPQGDRAYSSYVELCYPFRAGSVDLNAAVGATPWYSRSILPSKNQGFSVCNLCFGASKSIKISDNFSLPLSSKLTFNPALGDIYLVFGLSLYFSN